MRHLTSLDRALGSAGDWLSDLRALAGPGRPCPGDDQQDRKLKQTHRSLSGALMRVNHSGEIAAQGLYVGQALVARDRAVRKQMRKAAVEEADHLRWCRRRLRELDAQPSVLTPVWAAGSLAIGMVAGLAGDRQSLGFLEETERQVGEHLESHLQRLPFADKRSRAIVLQMRKEEEQHRREAKTAGAAEVPALVSLGMTVTARIMTWTSERI